MAAAVVVPADILHSQRGHNLCCCMGLTGRLQDGGCGKLYRQYQAGWDGSFDAKQYRCEACVPSILCALQGNEATCEMWQRLRDDMADVGRDQPGEDLKLWRSSKSAVAAG